MAKKEKKENYWVAEEVEVVVEGILRTYPDLFNHFSYADLQILFKAGKNAANKKHVNARIVRDPYRLLTSKKVILLITDSWWKESIDSDRKKALIEGLLSIETDEKGQLTKRDYDIQTYAELLGGKKADYSRFSKVLPAESKLELTAQ